MKIFYFPKNFSVFFCDPCFYVAVQRFTQPDYFILLDAKVLGMTLKDLVNFILDACNHNKKQIISTVYYIIFNFLKSNIKNCSIWQYLSENITLQYCLVVTLEVLILFDMNSKELCDIIGNYHCVIRTQKNVIVLCGSCSLKVSVLFYMNSDKRFLVWQYLSESFSII